MTSSHLVCELCGKPGPPGAFLFQDGVKVCLECYERENQPEGREQTSTEPVTPDPGSSSRSTITSSG